MKTIEYNGKQCQVLFHKDWSNRYYIRLNAYKCEWVTIQEEEDEYVYDETTAPCGR